MIKKNVIFISALALIGLFFAPQISAAATITAPANNLGLVGYWSFDDANGATLSDLSGYGNNGTVLGSSWISGKKSYALDFNGSASDYVNIPDADILDPGSSDMTVSLWFRADATGSLNGSILYNKENLYEASAGGGYFTYAWQPHWAWDGGTSFPITVGEWYHAVVVYDGTKQYLYKNGELVYERDQTGSIGSNTNRLAFATRGTSGGGSSPFNGAIDEVRIYHRALSTTEVQSLYNTNAAKFSAPDNTGLIGYWSMNDGSGTTVSDSSGNGNTGTFNGDPQWTDGKFGKALSFYGSDYVTFDTIDISGDITVSVWAYSDEFNQNGFLVGKNPVNNQWEIFFEGSQLRWRGASTENTVSCTTDTLDGGWHHFVGKQSGTSGELYIDGESCDTGTLTAIGNGAGTVEIGRFSSGYYFTGLIDEVRIYDSALSDDQITALYNTKSVQINTSQNDKLTDGLIGLWSFNGLDISGSNAYDRSGSGYDGTITGATTAIGKVGQAMTFDGSGDYIDMGTSPITGTSAFTLAAWINTDSVSAYSGAIAIGASASSQSAYIGTVNTAQVGTSNSIGGGFYGTNYGSGVTTTDEWVHVSMTFAGGSGGAAKIYVNGVEKVSTTHTPSISSATMKIGRIGTDTIYDFDGEIDEVRLYNRALTAEEVDRLYRLGR